MNHKMNQTSSYFLLQNYINIDDDIRSIIKKYLSTLLFHKDMIYQYNQFIQSFIDDHNQFHRNIMSINDIIYTPRPKLRINDNYYDCSPDNITHHVYQKNNNPIRSLLKVKITRDKKPLHFAISKFMTPIETIHK